MTSAEPLASKTDPAFKILIVDDNRDFVEFVNFLLSHHGFAVCCAFNGPDALETVREQAVDLVILDVMMPKMDGLTVCRELKQLRPALPVILVTAKDDLATRAAAMALGVSEFLAKPLNIDDFLVRVRTQLRATQWEKNLDDILATKTPGLAEPVKPA
ncbi:MAG TPA: response regulator [Terriglobales bacterium]|jgi:DNA-binding response OmpR family regulator|nr:response regulator [Terriglobales bacterium]